MGKQSVNQVEVGSGQLVTINVAGSTIFGGSGSDVFQALHDPVNALRTNGDIAGANSEIQSALHNVNLQRTFYGSTLQLLDSNSSKLSQIQINLTQQQTNLMAADMPKAASDLAQAQTDLNATLSAFGKISQTTLVDYLK